MTRKKEITLEDRAREGERLYSPTAARNRDVIRDVLVRYLPHEGTILEVGAGSGEHAVHFAAALPGVRWAPGDPDAASRASIAAWAVHEKLANVAPPHAIDVSAPDWAPPEGVSLAGIVSLNMIHIAPIEAAEGLIAGAGRHLLPGGVLFLYGPFSRHGRHTAPSNEAFDETLKGRDPRWGVRDLEGDITPLAQKAGLSFQAAAPMPANNFSVIFIKDTS